MMSFPNEDDLRSRRGRMAARRVDYFAGVMQFMAFLKTYGMGPVDEYTDGCHMTQSFEIPAGSPEERKAQADKLVQAFGAVPEWCNGRYMAVRQDAFVRTVVHFCPPILAPGGEAGKAA
jgi:hypothetical protein